MGCGSQTPVPSPRRRYSPSTTDCWRCSASPPCATGEWRLLECAPAWDGNWTSDCFLAFAWQGAGCTRLLVAVNYAPPRSQCYVRPPFADLHGAIWRLTDLMGDATYDRDGNDLTARGLFLDEPAWRASVFSLTRRS
jgi:hypothetical protein